jgi:hypothetical protein
LDDTVGISILVPCGSYLDLFETPQPGWTLADITCAVVRGAGGFSFGNTNSIHIGGFGAGDSGVFFNLGPGSSHLECTFINTAACVGGMSINTGTGSTDPTLHAPDPIWNVGLGTANVAGPAFGTPPAGPWVPAPAGTTWVEPSANGIFSDPVGTYDYNTSFFIPAGAPIVLNLRYAADESVIFSLSGPGAVNPPLSVTSPPFALAPPAPYPALYVSNPVSVSGIYTLHATVTNGPFGGSPTDTVNSSGLLVEGTVSCTVPPTVTQSIGEFCISGESTGVGWNWTVTPSSGPPIHMGTVPPNSVTPPGAASDIAYAWVNNSPGGLIAQGVTAYQLAGGQANCFVITPGGQTLTVQTLTEPVCTVTPSGCSFNPIVYYVPPVAPVGGVAALTVSSAGSPVPWMPLAAVAATALAVLAVGGWYAMRRFARR